MKTKKRRLVHDKDYDGWSWRMPDGSLPEMVLYRTSLGAKPHGGAIPVRVKRITKLVEVQD